MAKGKVTIQSLREGQTIYTVARQGHEGLALAAHRIAGKPKPVVGHPVNIIPTYFNWRKGRWSIAHISAQHFNIGSMETNNMLKYNRAFYSLKKARSYAIRLACELKSYAMYDEVLGKLVDCTKFYEIKLPILGSMVTVEDQVLYEKLTQAILERSPDDGHTD